MYYFSLYTMPHWCVQDLRSPSSSSSSSSSFSPHLFTALHFEQYQPVQATKCISVRCVTFNDFLFYSTCQLAFVQSFYSFIFLLSSSSSSVYAQPKLAYLLPLFHNSFKERRILLPLLHCTLNVQF